MSQFPSYSKLEQRPSGVTTRQSIGIGNVDTLGEYTSDTDPDDLASLYVDNLNAGQKNALPLDYRTVVMTLLLNYYKNDERFSAVWDSIDLQLQEIIDEILSNIPEDRDVTSDMVLKAIITNAIRLYTVFFGLPTAKQLGVVQDMNLYSGIRSYKMIVKNNLDILAPDDKWNLPTFISSSLSRDTALRFQNPSDRAMIHFVIPQSKLGEFPYAPLFKRDIQYPQRLADSIRENEVLLPPYCEFKFHGSRDETLSFNTWGLNAQGQEEVIPQEPVVTKVYYLEFVSFGKKMPDELERECAKNLNVKFKRRGGRKTRKRYKGGVLSERYNIPEEGICGLDKNTIKNLLNNSDSNSALGLSSDAIEGDIKKRYKELAIKIHPDKCDNDNATIIFQYLNEHFKKSLEHIKKDDINPEFEPVYSAEGRVPTEHPQSKHNILIGIISALKIIHEELIDNVARPLRYNVIRPVLDVNYDHREISRLSLEALKELKIELKEIDKLVYTLYEKIKKLEEKHLIVISRIPQDTLDYNSFNKDLTLEIKKINKEIIDFFRRHSKDDFDKHLEEVHNAIDYVENKIRRKERSVTGRVTKTIQKGLRTLTNRTRRRQGGKKNKRETKRRKKKRHSAKKHK